MRFLAAVGLCLAAMSASADEHQCQSAYAKLVAEGKSPPNRHAPSISHDALGALESETAQGSLYATQAQSTVESARFHNERLLETLKKPLEAVPAGWLGFLDGKATQDLLHVVDHAKVLDQAELVKYDPDPNCVIGFCFGRALGIQIEAIRRGLHPSRIKKIWAVGPVAYHNIEWKHHVATVVKGEANDWWVIDTNNEQPIMKIEDWMKDQAVDSKDHKLMFFVTNASRWGPDQDYQYYKSTLLNPFYNNYFRDYFASIRGQAKPPQLQNAPTDTPPESLP